MDVIIFTLEMISQLIAETINGLVNRVSVHSAADAVSVVFLQR